MRLATRSTVIVSALAIVSIGAPAASARFDLEPSATAHSQVTGPRPEVHPSRDHVTTHARTVTPPILRAARASEQPAISRSEAQRADALSYAPAASARESSVALNARVSSPSVPAAVHFTTHSSPFDWGDAAIGAAGGFGLSLLILGGALMVSQRRRTQAPAKAVTS